jgi:hypothetical protein
LIHERNDSVNQKVWSTFLMFVVSNVQVSIKSGGTGLNLVSANHVLITDLWWNQAVEQQVTTHYPLSLSRANVVRWTLALIL